jgi:hypothetical protein
VVGDQGPGEPTDRDLLHSGFSKLVNTVRDGDLRGADVAMSQIVLALDAAGGQSVQQTALLATAECLRARIELDAGHLGAARLSAATAVALADSYNSDETIRTNIRVLVSAARIAHDVGDIQTARGRASQALTTAQVTLGPSDRDTAYAWQVLEQACEAAGDSVAARAARRQARYLNKPATNPTSQGRRTSMATGRHGPENPIAGFRF